MSLADQVAEMIRKHRDELSPPKGAMQQFDRLMEAGLIRRREYDIPQVNVFGSSAQPNPSCSSEKMLKLQMDAASDFSKVFWGQQGQRRSGI